MIEIAIEKKEIGGTPILSDIKWKIEEGITLIMGPSGSGKTTLLREMIPRINRVGTLEGTVCYRGMPIDEVPAGRSVTSDRIRIISSYVIKCGMN